MKTIYEEVREERLELFQKGLVPDWMNTNGYLMLKDKYLDDGETPIDRYKTISSTLAKHTPKPAHWEKEFFNEFWRGWTAASTPVLANTGTNKGLPVSCSGGYVGDSVYDFYNGQTECAMLSKNGFGTSSYFGDIRPRGTEISAGGKASGILPVFKDYVQLSRDVSQGSTRRGAWAGYVPIDSADFWEVVNFILNNPDDANVGWIITDAYIDRLNKNDPDSIARYQRAMKVKCVTGKGYFWFPDKVNRLKPEWYKHFELVNKASNLCTEIDLHSDEDHTFTCVLSSKNLAKYDEWANTNSTFVSTVMLDCVCSEFIERAKDTLGLERAIRFTQKARALGLGALGFHTYLQSKMIPFESFQAHNLNQQIFSKIKEEAEKASKWMAKEWGEPEWCKGFGRRNTDLLAIAPNTSSALICGGVSQGIEPVYKNVYTQGSAAGELNRINPILLDLMKNRGIYSEDQLDDIIQNKGSVQHVDWLKDDEKLVFKTAFEIDQRAILRLASVRQQYICQAQSLNLFFAADESEEYISEIHKEAFLDPNIKSLYYLRSLAGVQVSKNECLACEG